jgi:hypothetical protein
MNRQLNKLDAMILKAEEKAKDKKFYNIEGNCDS